jgi:hypothetical protein
LFHPLEIKVDGSNARSVVVVELNSLFLLLVAAVGCWLLLLGLVVVGVVEDKLQNLQGR